MGDVTLPAMVDIGTSRAARSRAKAVTMADGSTLFTVESSQNAGWFLDDPWLGFRRRIIHMSRLCAAETEIAADRMSPSAAIVIRIVRLRDVQSISNSS